MTKTSSHEHAMPITRTTHVPHPEPNSKSQCVEMVNSSSHTHSGRSKQIFTDKRFWQLKPIQLNASGKWNFETLTDMVEDLPHNPGNDFEEFSNNVKSEAEQLAKSKYVTATNMARGLVMRCFTLGELYKRNTSGRSNGNYPVKLPIRPSRLQLVRKLVTERFSADTWDDCRRAIDSALRTLHRKLKLDNPEIKEWLHVLPPK